LRHINLEHPRERGRRNWNRARAKVPVALRVFAPAYHNNAHEPEYGSGFSYRQLAYCRQFYFAYPIVNALRSQFNWMQYRLLISISDNDKREYYELEAANNNWNGRELERQINALLYERLLMSNS
jgi:hypothetical protein